MRIDLLKEVLAITAAAGIGGTGLGGLASCFLRRDSKKLISLLLSFAAGVMTAVVCFDLLADALQAEEGGLMLAAGGILAGYVVVLLLNAWIDRREDFCGHGLFLAGVVMAAAIALHNMPEGMVIGAAFSQPAERELLNRSGLVTAAVIGLHNVPEGMAVAVPLISGGMKRPKAAAVTALTGAPTVLGAAAGFYLGAMGATALSLSLSFASGAMLYVVFGELLPESREMWDGKLPSLAAVVGIITGMVIVYA